MTDNVALSVVVVAGALLACGGLLKRMALERSHRNVGGLVVSGLALGLLLLFALMVVFAPGTLSSAYDNTFGLYADR